MNSRKKIIILILILTIGFAAISTTLVLNGVIGISNKKEDFNIIFTNAKLDEVEKKELIDSETKKTINYETNKLTTINQTTTLEYDVTNTSRLYDADVSITCNIVDDTDKVITSEYVSMEYTPESMTVHSGETKSGSITTKLIKGSTEDKSIKVKCTLNASATERDSLGEEYKEPGTYELIVDVNNNDIADIGDEIQVGTESFYVISHTDTELNALAKYNLNVGDNKNPNVTEGIQHETVRGSVEGITTYGNVAFSNSSGWSYDNDAVINSKDYDGPVKEALYGENGYEKYIQNFIHDSSVRLITKAELEGLGCSGSSCSSAPSWVYNTTYWTQSAYSGRYGFVWFVRSDGYFGGGDSNRGGNDYGVRPVITIPLFN